MVDSVIIMCCPDRTHFKPIQYCSRSLTEAGANILGAVVNDIEISNASAFTPHSHGHSYHKYGYGGYGYGYGYGYKPQEDKKKDNGTSAMDGEGVKEDNGGDEKTSSSQTPGRRISDIPKGFTDDE